MLICRTHGPVVRRIVQKTKVLFTHGLCKQLFSLLNAWQGRRSSVFEVEYQACTGSSSSLRLCKPDTEASSK